jgi:hypothetical protein
VHARHSKCNMYRVQRLFSSLRRNTAGSSDTNVTLANQRPQSNPHRRHTS